MTPIKQLVPKSKFILALSGGSDSLAAALYFKNKGYDFTAVHFNGNFIPQDAITQTNVEKFCAVYEIPLVVELSDKVYKSGSKEAFCRNERYLALGKACCELNVFNVVTGHNLQDAVTSYLWNVFRGNPDFNPIPFETVFEFPTFKVTRPFLLTSKGDMKMSVPQEFVTEDELNQDLTLTRNWIRDVIVPAIHQKKHFNLNTVVAKIVGKKLKKYLESREKLDRV